VSDSEQPEAEVSGFDRAAADAKSRAFFDGLWADRDPWDLDRSELDQRRYARQLELLADRRYARALEIGCGGGAFTRRLAAVCDELVALDVSRHAIDRARAAGTPSGVEFRLANVMEIELEQEGSWDLVVLTETAYYLGWLYPMFEIGWLAHSLHEATVGGGRLLLANTVLDDDGIMSGWLIRSYRDIFARVGYDVEREEVLRGLKESVELEVLITLFRKPGPGIAPPR
jgi:predicted TPR repeat methyltransferase